jgi:hypothetical protein
VVCRVTGPDGLEDIGELVDQLLQIGRAARGDGPRIRVAWGGGGEAAVAFTRAFVVSLAEESPRVSPELVGAPNGGLLRATPTEETAFALPPGAVVLITGGARGVTAVLARHLVARGARLVLLGA